MAYQHIRLTKRAASTIQAGFKYFMAKKQLYLLRKEIEPDSVGKSQFLAQILQKDVNNLNLSDSSYREDEHLKKELDLAY